MPQVVTITDSGARIARQRGRIISAFFFLLSSCAVWNFDSWAGYILLSVVSWNVIDGAFRNGHSWFCIYFSFFFVLGNWFKVTVHGIFDYEYIEPTGSFSFEADHWDKYFILSSLIGLAIIVAKKSFVGAPRRLRVGGGQGSEFEHEKITGHSVKWAEWMILIFAVSCYYYFNFTYSFFKIGVAGSAGAMLPSFMNAPLSFMSYLGMAIVVAMYVSRDVNSKGFLSLTAALVVLLASLIGSISMASRATVVVHALPIIAGAIYQQLILGGHRIKIGPIIALPIILAISLLVVSAYRITVYWGGDYNDPEAIRLMSTEAALLTVDRWVGAEAIMVGVAEPNASFGFFLDIIKEDPKLGEHSIFQAASKSQYVALDGYTFLSLPGYYGIASLTGSLWFVTLTAFLISAFGIYVERLMRQLIDGDNVVISLMCAAVANSFVSMSFPALIIPFFIFLSASVIAVRCVRNSRKEEVAKVREVKGAQHG